MTWFKSLLYVSFFMAFTWFYIKLLGGNEATVITLSLPAALYLLVGLLLSLSSFQASEIVSAFRAGFQARSQEWIPGNYGLHQTIFRSMGLYALLSGAAGSLIGIVLALANMESQVELMMALATAFLPLLYAIGFRCFVLYPFEIALEKKLRQSQSELMELL